MTNDERRTTIYVWPDLYPDQRQSFDRSFRIGRDKSCEFQVTSPLVSRVHAEVTFEDGTWWIADQNSRNGLHVDGERVQRIQLKGKHKIRLGEVDAPRLHISTQAVGASGASDLRDKETVFQGAARPREGTRTRMLRRSYAEMMEQGLKQQKRRFGMILGLVMGLVGILIGFVIYQTVQYGDQERQAVDLFYAMRDMDQELAEMRALLIARGGADVADQLERMRARRRELAGLYAGYVEQLGTYRKLTTEERLIYRTARAFNECEFEIPADFVEAVREEIYQNWVGNRRWVDAVQRAEERGYTPFIVETFQQYGLPPEFFYLALQESNFNRLAVGPPTRYGRAKGMWQFIPETGEAYGLVPFVEGRVATEADARHDFERSTVAAAQYLSDIYVKLAEASGLLAMASYNWGEHRVISKLETLFEGIPEGSRQRTYWTFFQQYQDRMPEQTKDYVLKIVAAAVVGQNPRQFGFDFDNPLQPYLEL